jgi:hypothetical protein
VNCKLHAGNKAKVRKLKVIEIVLPGVPISQRAEAFRNDPGGTKKPPARGGGKLMDLRSGRHFGFRGGFAFGRGGFLALNVT